MLLNSRNLIGGAIKNFPAARHVLPLAFGNWNALEE
jgi:hypothetical protein